MTVRRESGDLGKVEQTKKTKDEKGVFEIVVEVFHSSGCDNVEKLHCKSVVFKLQWNHFFHYVSIFMY